MDTIEVMYDRFELTQNNAIDLEVNCSMCRGIETLKKNFTLLACGPFRHVQNEINSVKPLDLFCRNVVERRERN